MFKMFKTDVSELEAPTIIGLLVFIILWLSIQAVWGSWIIENIFQKEIHFGFVFLFLFFFRLVMSKAMIELPLLCLIFATLYWAFTQM